MALLVNLRHLAVRNVSLQGELSIPELELESRDKMIQARQPAKYELVVEKVNANVLVGGCLRMVLDCQCVRCLEAFPFTIELQGRLCEVALEGEEAAPVMNECVDLTPYLREDILLQFPPHPLCKPDCRGLSVRPRTRRQTLGLAETDRPALSAWAELDKLKL